MINIFLCAFAESYRVEDWVNPAASPRSAVGRWTHRWEWQKPPPVKNLPAKLSWVTREVFYLTREMKRKARQKKWTVRAFISNKRQTFSQSEDDTEVQQGPLDRLPVLLLAQLDSWLHRDQRKWSRSQTQTISFPQRPAPWEPCSRFRTV